MSPTVSTKFDLIRLFAEMGFTKGAEVGVSEGYLSEFMVKTIPNLELYCVDPWKPYRGNRWGGSSGGHTARYQKATARLKNYRAHLIRAMSQDAVKNFGYDSLDFVYIDANHSFDYVMIDIIEWSLRVRKGGIVSGDDYYRFRGAGIIEAVNAYTDAHGIKYNLTDPYSVKAMDRGYPEQPSFWWIK